MSYQYNKFEAVFNCHINNADKKSRKDFIKKYGIIKWLIVIKPFLKQGVMTIFDTPPNDCTLYYVNQIEYHVNKPDTQMLTTLKETWDHYERMIQWAEKQDKKGRVHKGSMESNIGESWSGIFCPCCDAYYDSEVLLPCTACPLRNYADPEPYHCCNDLWEKMGDTPTWNKWIKYAKKLQKLIEKRIVNERRKV